MITELHLKHASPGDHRASETNLPWEADGSLTLGVDNSSRLRLELWHLAIERQSRFVAQLTQLRSLELCGWPTTYALQRLMLDGAASYRHLTELHLLGPAFSMACSSVVRQAYPHLKKLTLGSIGKALTVIGDVFQPLNNSPLEEVSVIGQTSHTLAGNV